MNGRGAVKGYRGTDLKIKNTRKFGGKPIRIPEMAGTGVISTLKTFGNMISDLAFGKVGTTISNVASELFNSNPEWRPGFAGEKHLLLPTDHGLTRANFAGPGTNLKVRLPRGDKSVDGPEGIDAASKVHDIAYTNAKTVADIRAADLAMIKAVRNGTAGVISKEIVIAGLKAKTFGEDVGIINVDTFTPGILDNKKKAKKEVTPASKLLKKTLRKIKSLSKKPVLPTTKGKGRTVCGPTKKRGKKKIKKRGKGKIDEVIKKVKELLKKNGNALAPLPVPVVTVGRGDFKKSLAKFKKLIKSKKSKQLIKQLIKKKGKGIKKKKISNLIKKLISKKK